MKDLYLEMARLWYPDPWGAMVQRIIDWRLRDAKRKRPGVLDDRARQMRRARQSTPEQKEKARERARRLRERKRSDEAFMEKRRAEKREYRKRAKARLAT